MRKLTPGSWYSGYFAAWRSAHPGRDTRDCGSFGGVGDVWTSKTMDWDRQWFAEVLKRRI
jgi:hypothetical protein